MVPSNMGSNRLKKINGDRPLCVMLMHSDTIAWTQSQVMPTGVQVVASVVAHILADEFYSEATADWFSLARVQP